MIKKNIEIKKILLTGRKIHTKYGIFFIDHTNTDNRVNFAVLIKKNVGNAVWRNYCKRIVRAYVRKKYDLFTQYSKFLFLYTYDAKINYNLLEKEFDKKLDTL